MAVYRLFTGADGESHIEELKPQDHPELRDLQATSGIRLQEFPAKQFIDWHPAPRRQWVIILSGELKSAWAMERSGDSDLVMRAWWRIPLVAATPRVRSAINPAWQWQFTWLGNAPPRRAGLREIALTRRAYNSVCPRPQAL